MGDDTAQSIGTLVRGESSAFDQLLLTLYRSIHTSSPWSEFLHALCGHFQACAATLVVRQPARGDRGYMFHANVRQSLMEVYRTANFPDDPFLDLEEGVACNIFDRVSREAFLRSRFYNELLKLDNDTDVLALNVTFGNTYLGSLKLSRREPIGVFGLPEKALMMRIYPHLKVALEIYERSRRQYLENNAYIRAIDQLAFGVVILNERGHVIRVNETASRMMKESQLLRVVGNYLQAGEPEHEILVANAIKAILGRSGAEASVAGSLKISAAKSNRSLYMLLKPIHESTPDPSNPPAGVAIFLSADKLQHNVSIEAFAKLYHISRAEMALVTELLDGASIIEASTTLGISENTARVQLRSVFTKTDTHRQADLIRLVLTSLAIIA
jgi:DNA-binding CsgD family transcriptional regulator/PAS domain-containing protein